MILTERELRRESETVALQPVPRYKRRAPVAFLVTWPVTTYPDAVYVPEVGAWWTGSEFVA